MKNYIFLYANQYDHAWYRYSIFHHNMATIRLFNEMFLYYCLKVYQHNCLPKLFLYQKIAREKLNLFIRKPIQSRLVRSFTFWTQSCPSGTICLYVLISSKDFGRTRDEIGRLCLYASMQNFKLNRLILTSNRFVNIYDNITQNTLLNLSLLKSSSN